MRSGLKIWRDDNGIPHVEAESRSSMYWGQGYVHAKDRGMQMLLMRILAQGRASELLDSSDETLEIDKFFRRMNWGGNTGGQIDKLEPKDREYLESYCEGVNAAFKKKYPWEFKLLGYRPEKWMPEDCSVISRMMGYLTLAQSQADMERFFVELVQSGISREKLQALFPGILGEMDMDLIKKVTLNERIVSPASLWNMALPRMMASNNWVISGKKTASGKPIVCNDPHLEINRLPNIWCEMVLTSEKRFMTGGSMPGFPGVITGRTKDIAWGVTYAFIDAVDSWVEKCKDGKCYREDGDQWVAFQQRKEIIKRKKKKDVTFICYENEHGILDGDPQEEGHYLATRWASAESGPSSLSAIFNLWNVSSIDDAMDTLGKIETGWSFVMATTYGDIAFQMSGLAPKRREGVSGFVPLPGWKRENDWQGYHSHRDLPRIKNPEEGYFATSNQNLNHYGIAKPINMPMGSYRSDRISALLEGGNSFTKTDMYPIHSDVYSPQAALFMEILKPLLPDTSQGKTLGEWDLNYQADSEGAFLFEEFYQQLYSDVFGKNGLGTHIIDYLADETGIFIDFYDNFDKVLLSESSCWFGDLTREQIFKQAAVKSLKVPVKKWGNVRKFTLTHILFGGKLPAFLGFDRGPVTGIGSRATIHQGQIYRSADRDTTFMPSLRMVTDLSNNDTFTNLVGGPSDRRFSKWYCSDLENWITGKYKRVSPDPDQNKLKF